MIIYADITFINNFLMSFAIIWAVANIMETEYKLRNIFLASIVANIYLLMVILIQFLKFNLIITAFLHILLNILAAIIIIKITFPELKKRLFLKAYAYLYLVSFIAIGTTVSLFYIYRGPVHKDIQRIIFLGAIVVLLIGNFGWKIFQKYKTPDQFFIPLSIYYQNNMVNLVGLLDTGNSLTDPFTKVPVIVVNLDDILSLFPLNIREELRKTGEDYIAIIDILNNAGLGDRVRILPFSDLGKENGIIPGFRPDFIELYYKEKTFRRRKCVIAVSRRKLDLNNEYQALIHPQLINTDSISNQAQ